MTNISVDVKTVAHASVLDGFTQAPAREVRNWANMNGFTIKVGPGRMPMAAVLAFNAAHEGEKRQYVLATGTAGAASSALRKYEYTTATGRKGKTIPTNPQRIRAWANSDESTYEGAVPSRGRLTQTLVDAFGQAHAPKRKSASKS
jgi:hypothetical protein